MQDHTQYVVHSLQLVSPQTQALISKLESVQNGDGSTTSGQIVLACQVAKATLGPDYVQRAPVNQSEADANWSVSIRASNCQTLIIVIQV